MMWSTDGHRTMNLSRHYRVTGDATHRPNNPWRARVALSHHPRLGYVAEHLGRMLAFWQRLGYSKILVELNDGNGLRDLDQRDVPIEFQRVLKGFYR